MTNWLKARRLGSRVVGGIIAMILAVAAVSVYTFWRVERVQENVELVNRFYVPVLKHLNLLSGKWSAYQRSYEHAVAFRRWGAKKFNPTSSKLHLRKMVDSNLSELNKIVERHRSALPATELADLTQWMEKLSRLSEAEPTRSIEITSLVKARQFSEAASVYARARQDHFAITSELKQLSRAVENRVALLQLATEQELRNSQGIMLLLLGLSLLFSLVVLFRLRRWLLPIMEWTRVAQEIAMKGLNNLGREIRFPKITRGMPPEIALLTREFTRMGMTVLERERTIQHQKVKLESLNGHLKDQNEMLRKLGGLNERVLNSMSSGLLVVGIDGFVEQFNEKYCELFKTNRNQVLGSNARELLKAWPVEQVRLWLDPSTSSDSFQLNRAELNGRVFDVRVQPLSAAGGYLLLFEDVTELVKAEEKLEHANKLMLAGNMSSQVAHEVRNPLNSMSLQLEMLEEDIISACAVGAHDTSAASSTDEASLKRVRAVAEQVRRLERITQKYLDVRRAVPVVRQKIDLHELIEKSLSFLSGELQANQIRVELQLAPTPIYVAGDGDALAQVLFNLVRNAIDAMKSVALNRVLRVVTKLESQSVCIAVEDTGPGVNNELKARLFEPFVTDKANGHGLGLSVSRQICIDHGGELRFVESTRPHGQAIGAAFEFNMPLLELPVEKGM